MNSGISAQKAMAIGAVLVLILAAFCIAPATADDTGGIEMPSSGHFDLVLSDGNTKYFKFDSEGLNALHLTTDPGSEPYGQVTTTDEQSGVFYVSETGGRGFFDDIILMVAINGTIPDDFALHVRASGYQWTPTSELNVPPRSDEIEHVDGAYEGTITKDDFKYSPQTWKPAGKNLPGAYPLYYGQDTSDTSNTFHLIFIDLHAGTLGPKSMLSGLTDNGAVKIEYEFENLGPFASFNTYGWCNQSNQGQGISWTNRVVGDQPSGYEVIGTTPQGGDVASESGGDSSGTSTSSGLSGTEFTTQDSGVVNGTATILPISSNPVLLGGGESTTLSVPLPATNGTVKKATLYLFVNGSKQKDTESGIKPSLEFSVDGTEQTPDRTATDREGGTDAPFAATYAFDLSDLPASGSLSVAVENTGSQDAVCTLDGGALFVVRENSALPEITWQVAEGCDAVAIDNDAGVYEEDAVTTTTFDEPLDLDWISAGRLYVVGTGPEVLTNGSDNIGLNDKGWSDALGRNGSVLMADIDVASALLPRENMVTVSSQRNAGDGGVLVNRLAVLVTTCGTPAGTNTTEVSGTVSAMRKAFVIDNPVVSLVSVTLPEQYSPFLVTVEDTETSGGEAPEGEVYRYVKVRIEGSNSAPSSLAITFHVPSAWLTAHSLNASDIVLMRRYGGEWKSLPTVVDEENNGSVEFTAQADGISLFAIEGTAARGAVSSVATTATAEATTTPQSTASCFPVVAALAALLLVVRRH